MGVRRAISLTLCVFFAVSASTGILLGPGMRFLIGINNEGMWRMVHFYSTNAVAVLIILHIIENRKALVNYLRTARTGSIIAYSMAVIILAGVISFGVWGWPLDFTSPLYEEDIRRARLPDPTLISFPEDFEDGKADGWKLGSGWEIKLENDNHVLSGSSVKWTSATPKVSGWFNYTLTTNVKLVSGKLHISARTTETPFRSRYLIGIDEYGLHLGREIDGDHNPIAGGQIALSLNEWHQITIVLKGTHIKIYCDDVIQVDCTDSDLPLIFGGFYFEVAPESYAMFDDINLTVNES